MLAHGMRTLSHRLIVAALLAVVAPGTMTGQTDNQALRALAGDAVAQYNLGVKYHEGQGVPQDYAEALKWYRKAAEQGLANAQYNIGILFEAGRGVPQDTAEAVKWYRLAAEQGDADAQVRLGYMYAVGHGVVQDSTEAVMWLRLAAEQGHADAQYALGRAYLTGQGVVQSEVEALKWFATVAEEGQVALHTAAENGDVLVAEFLLANETDPNAREEKLGHSPLHATAIPGVEALANLEAAGLDLSEMTIENALSGALRGRLQGLSIDPAGLRDPPVVQEAKTALAKLLLDHGADVNAANQLGQTPLFGAVTTGNSSVVEVLLAGNAKVNVSDRWGTTPLDYAVLYGNEDVARVLLYRGAIPMPQRMSTGANLCTSRRIWEMRLPQECYCLTAPKLIRRMPVAGHPSIGQLPKGTPRSSNCCSPTTRMSTRGMRSNLLRSGPQPRKDMSR